MNHIGNERALARGSLHTIDLSRCRISSNDFLLYYSLVDDDAIKHRGVFPFNNFIRSRNPLTRDRDNQEFRFLMDDRSFQGVGVFWRSERKAGGFMERSGLYIDLAQRTLQPDRDRRALHDCGDLCVYLAEVPTGPPTPTKEFLARSNH